MVAHMKRSDERQGHAHEAKSVQIPVDKVTAGENSSVPEANPDWSPIAAFAWQAHLDSPLQRFYIETDHVFVWVACEAIDKAVKGKSATQMMAAESMMRAAMFNESDRRRVRIEVSRKEPEKNPVVDKNVADFTARRQARGSG